jgi:hypothetical protein
MKNQSEDKKALTNEQLEKVAGGEKDKGRTAAEIRQRSSSSWHSWQPHPSQSSSSSNLNK